MLPRSTRCPRGANRRVMCSGCSTRSRVYPIVFAALCLMQAFLAGCSSQHTQSTRVKPMPLQTVTQRPQPMSHVNGSEYMRTRIVCRHKNEKLVCHTFPPTPYANYTPHMGPPSAPIATPGAWPMQAVRGRATFRSEATGDITVLEIFGDTSAPWYRPPKRLTLVFGEQSKASVLSQLVKQHAILPRVVINDPGDGEFWALENVEAAQYATRQEGSTHTAYPMVKFNVGTAHLRCGPPTCQNPLWY